MYYFFTFFLLFILFFLIFFHFRKRKIIRKICCMTIQEKCCLLNELTEPLGYCYDVSQDIFTSTTDAWQKKFGYGAIYDKFAPLFNMVMDCQPVYFDKEKKTWLIEFWKGQYGMSAGAEVGIYSSDYSDTPLEAPQNRHYESVDDSELFPIKINLFHEEELMVTREKKHWWLTGFVLGEFSHKEELGMEISITFRDFQMRNAFYDALLAAGYRKENICVNGACVRFSFTRPCHACPKHCRLRVWWVQWKNKRNCRRYRRVTRCFVRTIDKVDYLGMCFPWLYRLLGRCSRIPCKKKCRRRSV